MEENEIMLLKNSKMYVTRVGNRMNVFSILTVIGTLFLAVGGIALLFMSNMLPEDTPFYIDNIMDDEPDKTKWVRENLWENEVYEILKIASDEDDFIARLENKFNESNALPSDFIASKLNGFQRVELINAMNMAIEESIKAIEGTKDEQESFAWYKECKMDEYFHWQELWNNDVKVGEGIDTIAHKFILNDETRQDFEECFEQARDQAIENTKEYFGE